MSLPPLAFGRVSLARAERHADVLAARYLSPREREEVSTLRVPKRRTERIAGRVAARRALARLGVGGSDVSVVAIEAGEAAGAPSVVGANRQDVSVSIAHGAGSAFAVASLHLDLGLDIERIEPRAAAFVEDAFEPVALATLTGLLGTGVAQEVVATVAWCAKEACMKLTRTGMRAELRSFAPLAASWVGPMPASGSLREGLRPVILETRELGVLEAAVAVHRDVALVLVWRPRGCADARLS